MDITLFCTSKTGKIIFCICRCKNWKIQMERTLFYEVKLEKWYSVFSDVKLENSNGFLLYSVEVKLDKWYSLF